MIVPTVERARQRQDIAIRPRPPIETKICDPAHSVPVELSEWRKAYLRQTPRSGGRGERKGGSGQRHGTERPERDGLSQKDGERLGYRRSGSVRSVARLIGCDRACAACHKGDIHTGNCADRRGIRAKRHRQPRRAASCAERGRRRTEHLIAQRPKRDGLRRFTDSRLCNCYGLPADGDSSGAHRITGVLGYRVSQRAGS